MSPSFQLTHSGVGRQQSHTGAQRGLQEVTASGVVKADDLKRFADDFGDLADPEIMARAWE